LVATLAVHLARAQQAGHRRARKGGNPVLGYGCLHAALDDHFRLADSETLADVRKQTAAAFRARGISLVNRRPEE
jgi:hypothetical protein